MPRESTTSFSTRIPAAAKRGLQDEQASELRKIENRSLTSGLIAFKIRTSEDPLYLVKRGDFAAGGSERQMSPLSIERA